MLCEVLWETEISIHAPVKGATYEDHHQCKSLANFNPRSREGSDVHLMIGLRLCPVFQSTLP